jgi:LmbE family N-acetylglucosaminyl deacetylase
LVEPLTQGAWADARWLVLAPHPDDETLGAGALIYHASRIGRLAGVVFLTDGAASHPTADADARARLARLRQDEAAEALGLLCGGEAVAVDHLGWPDAHPFEAGSAAFDDTVVRLVSICRARGVTALAVTADHEPHCDHAAASGVAAAVGAVLDLDVFDYLVWGEGTPPDCRTVVITPAMPASVRAQALAAHASQLTDIAGPGFRLDADRQVMSDHDYLYLRGGAP